MQAHKIHIHIMKWAHKGYTVDRKGLSFVTNDGGIKFVVRS